MHYKSLLENENLNQSLEFIRSNGYSKHDLVGFSKVLRLTNDLLLSGNKSIDDFKVLQVEYYNRALSNQEVSPFSSKDVIKYDLEKFIF